MTGIRLEFDWDPGKAETNRRKHRVNFEEAMSILADPLALSRLDDESSEGEERWVTLGRNGAGKLLVMVHTFVELSGERAAIRIISARAPTRREVRQYESG
ncbi:BrnT family toxin [Mesorhizobium sp. CN2-181]|uniref:BrnT family toxin n=1 Tax=Mesorhizobium yinganensis TaxID=3157707 RepID=UPI0032B87CC6